ncbi:hypothetical protein [Legionella genomosp. 1]|uniref:hypothetical protein n=1 Tax=Legionella genomosp. 1 TaxID=1093625 RepID=UPI001056C04C|nr:hypothetical protein [Legionella genomosp. 1]
MKKAKTKQSKETLENIKKVEDICKVIMSECERIAHIEYNPRSYDVAWEELQEPVNNLKQVTDIVYTLNSDDLQKKVNETWLTLAARMIDIADWHLSVVKGDIPRGKTAKNVNMDTVFLWRNRGFDYLVDASLHIPFYHHFLDVKIAYHLAGDETKTDSQFRKIISILKKQNLLSLEKATASLYMPYLVELFEIALDVSSVAKPGTERDGLMKSIKAFADSSIRYPKGTTSKEKKMHESRFQEFRELVAKPASGKNKKALQLDSSTESFEYEPLVGNTDSDDDDIVLYGDGDSMTEDETESETEAEKSLKEKYAKKRKGAMDEKGGEDLPLSKKRNVLHTNAVIEEDSLLNSSDAVDFLVGLAAPGTSSNTLQTRAPLINPNLPEKSISSNLDNLFFGGSNRRTPSPSPEQQRERAHKVTDVTNALVKVLEQMRHYDKSYQAKVLEHLADSLRTRDLSCCVFLYRQAVAMDSMNDELLFKYTSTAGAEKVACVSKDKGTIFNQTLNQLPEMLNAVFEKSSGNEYKVFVLNSIETMSDFAPETFKDIAEHFNHHLEQICGSAVIPSM